LLCLYGDIAKLKKLITDERGYIMYLNEQEHSYRNIASRLGVYHETVAKLMQK